MSNPRKVLPPLPDLGKSGCFGEATIFFLIAIIFCHPKELPANFSSQLAKSLILNYTIGMGSHICVMLATSNTAVKKKRDMVFIAFPDFITFVKNLLCSYSRRHRDLSSFEIQLVSDFLGKTRQILLH